MKHHSTVFAALAMVVLVLRVGFGQDVPFLLDLAKLNLVVRKTEVTPRLSEGKPRPNTVELKELVPNSGFKLVVVTLEGRVPHPCRINIGPSEFAALFVDDPFPGATPATKREIVRPVMASALAVRDDWMIEERGIPVIGSVYYFNAPTAITIRAAFILPTRVDSFTIRYPTTAKGNATLSAGQR